MNHVEEPQNPLGLNSPALVQRLKNLDDHVKNGTLFEASKKDLEDGLHALCEQRTADVFSTREISKGFLVTTILMERRSRWTNSLIIFLAITGVLGTLAQVVIGVMGLCK